MISKRFRSAQWMNGPATELVRAHRRGTEVTELSKQGGFDGKDPFFDGIVSEPGHAFVHVVSLGAGNYYGANSNADWFNERAQPWEFPLADTLHKTAQLDGGLEKYHSTFMKFGAVYHRHQNSRKGGTPKGSIVRERLHPNMHRGELILKLAEDEWGPQLDKIAVGLPVFWSMGTGVPFDFCSVCGNQASKRSEYCDHLKWHKLELTKEGHQIFAINDRPHFHDISDVPKPADLIAFGLRKVAGGLQDDEEDLGGLWLPVSLVCKLAGRRIGNRADKLRKLAEIEKRLAVEPTAMERDVATAFQPLNTDEEDDIVQKLIGIPLDRLLASTFKHRVLLPPRVFVRIVIGKKPQDIEGLDDVPTAVRNIFSNVCASDGIDRFLDDGSFLPGFVPPTRTEDEAVSGLSKQLSLSAAPVRHRVTIVAIRGGKPEAGAEKEAAAQPGKEAAFLAREYAKYELAFAEAANDPLVDCLTVMQNRRQG